MAVASAQQLQASCQTFSGRVAAHHQTASDLLTQFEGHLSEWVSDCEQWIGSETNTVDEAWHSQQMQHLLQVIEWLDQHRSTIQSIGDKAIELFDTVTG